MLIVGKSDKDVDDPGGRIPRRWGSPTKKGGTAPARSIVTGLCLFWKASSFWRF